jgi:hypothetical protein
MKNTIALMWDCNGLEAVANLSEISKKRTWASLKGEKMPELPNLMHWELRARYNSQRHYEIYIIETDEDITVDVIRTAFERDPQHMADTVRKIGHKFYSDQLPQKVSIR